MGIEIVLTELLGSGVIEKGILVWMIIKLNEQTSMNLHTKSKLNEISRISEQCEDLRAELSLLSKEVNEINTLGCKQGSYKCHLAQLDNESDK